MGGVKEWFKFPLARNSAKVSTRRTYPRFLKGQRHETLVEAVSKDDGLHDLVGVTVGFFWLWSLLWCHGGKCEGVLGGGCERENKSRKKWRGEVM